MSAEPLITYHGSFSVGADVDANAVVLMVEEWLKPFFGRLDFELTLEIVSETAQTAALGSPNPSTLDVSYTATSR